MPRRSADYHGLLIVDKPGADSQVSPSDPSSTTTRDERLYTSHDIVQLARSLEAAGELVLEAGDVEYVD